MKPLEAFKRFRDNIRWIEENTSLKTYFEIDDLHFKEDLDTIETVLNRSEELEKTNIVLTHQLDHERKIRIRQEKKLKALEIIKEKPVLTPCIFIYETYKEYIKECGEWNKVKKDTCYTKEEFNLLKEVLL